MPEQHLDCILKSLSNKPVAGTLATVSHNPTKCSNQHHINTGMPVLAGNIIEEAIVSHNSTVKSYQNGLLNISATDDLILLSYQQPSQSDIEQQSYDVYAAILHHCESLGFKHLMRSWNYFKDINKGTGDNERYRLFCQGRYRAFEQFNIGKQDFPAASALGNHSDSFVVYVLASKTANIHIENPEQTSAFEYPKNYGPQSPSFARATLCPQFGKFFVSGTASIKGHESLHTGDVSRQLIMVLDNIDKLAEHTEHTHQLKLTPDWLKVYVRHKEDLTAVKALLSTLKPNIPALFLHADICRQELLVEIETSFSFTLG